MKVLIAIDGSKCSEVAFDSVLHRQWLPVDQFRIVSVVELIIGQYPLAMSYGDTIIQAQHELIAGGQELVRVKIAQLQSKFPENQVTGEVIEGFAAEAILAESKAWLADVIVLGSHGRKGINKFLLGSVAEKVASQALCSIEIIKTHQPAANSERATESLALQASVAEVQTQSALTKQAIVQS